ncbi:acidic endochitinase [Hepatospora eriocheir]|nr:acidic endochitinase [Hepatospora eriocheir]
MNACSKMGDEPNPEYVDAVAEGINEKSEEELPFDMKVQALGQFGHESGCFKFIEEIDCKDNKCPDKYGADQGAPGKQYYGRGFIQLSWPDNYKAASQAINNDLSFFEQPELVAEPKNAILTSLWFWMERVMTAENVGPEHFGYSTKAINGELECTGQNVDKSKKRYEYYKAFAEELGLEKIADEVGCY